MKRTIMITILNHAKHFQINSILALYVLGSWVSRNPQSDNTERRSCFKTRKKRKTIEVVLFIIS